MLFDMFHNERDSLLLFVPQDGLSARDLIQHLGRLETERRAGKKYRLFLRNALLDHVLNERAIVVRDCQINLPETDQAPDDIAFCIYQRGRAMDGNTAIVFDRFWSSSAQKKSLFFRLHYIGETYEHYPILVFSLVDDA